MEKENLQAAESGSDKSIIQEKKDLVVRDTTSSVMSMALKPQDVKRQMALIQRLMKSVMKKDEDYGIIEGCKKPSLLKPGAEKLNVMFRLDPQYERTFIELGNNHLEVRSNCTLIHIPTGNIVGHGGGSCSTMEKKYRWRQGDRKCPSCGKIGTIIRGKADFGGGWLCWGKKGGCGSRWEDGAKEIEMQDVGQVENPDIADARNTVEKMADKRGMIAADLNATGASAIFTQDIEDVDPAQLGLNPTKKVGEAENNNKAAPEAKAETRAENPADLGIGDDRAEPPPINGNGNGKKISIPQIKRLFAIGYKNKHTEKEIMDAVKQHGFDKAADITQSKYGQIVHLLEV